MGKSRLVGETRELAAAAGMRVLSARGGELEHDFSYGVVRQLFEPVLALAPAAEREELLGGAAALAAPLFDERRSAGGTVRGRLLLDAARALLAGGEPRVAPAAAARDRRPALGRRRLAPLARLPRAQTGGAAAARRRGDAPVRAGDRTGARRGDARRSRRGRRPAAGADAPRGDVDDPRSARARRGRRVRRRVPRGDGRQPAAAALAARRTRVRGSRAEGNERVARPRDRPGGGVALGAPPALAAAGRSDAARACGRGPRRRRSPRGCRGTRGARPRPGGAHGGDADAERHPAPRARALVRAPRRARRRLLRAEPVGARARALSGGGPARRRGRRDREGRRAPAADRTGYAAAHRPGPARGGRALARERRPERGRRLPPARDRGAARGDRARQAPLPARPRRAPRRQPARSGAPARGARPDRRRVRKGRGRASSSAGRSSTRCGWRRRSACSRERSRPSATRTSTCGAGSRRACSA